MESMDVAGVLQEAGDADSRACTRSQILVEYFINPYTSTSIRLHYLCQGYHYHCVATANHGGWEDWGWFINVTVWVEGQGVGIMFFLFSVLLFSCCQLFFDDCA